MNLFKSIKFYLLHLVRGALDLMLKIRLNSKRVIHRTIVRESGGIKIDVSYSTIPFSVVKQLDANKYEAEEFDLVTKALPNDIDVIELGAGIGYISCLINKLTTVENTHVAVEANPRLIPIIKRNKDINDANFVILEKAYSSSGEQSRFYIDQAFPWSSTTNPRNENNVTAVENITLADICDKFGIHRFSLVCDIEGAEFDLIANEIGFLRSHCNVMIIEIHDTVDLEFDPIDKIKQNGYKITEQKGRTYAFRKRNS